MIIDFAERAHNHNWDLDPVVRSLLDTDFYKLLMLQFIWKHFPTTQVSFSVTNRSSAIRLADVIAREEVLQQLEHVRSLRFLKSELIWLAGNTFFGRRGIFEPDFLEWLGHGFRLSSYRLTVRDGEFHLQFDGLWTEATMWEIYAQAKAKLWGKIERLTGVPELRVADFGTRRRHSFLWQEYVVMAMNTALGEHFTGTSNTYLAYKHNLEAVGTNAHELPMALAAMATSDAELKSSQYRILELWQSTYAREIRIMLPDTYGTTQFLADAPDWTADWTGQRIDSKDPYIAGDEYIAWLEQRGRDPKQKLIIASDAMDVEDILGLHAYFMGTIALGLTPKDFRSAADLNDPAKWTPCRRIRFSAGWGTLLTNDFRGCHPNGGNGFNPASLICKMTEADGRPAVKLSDNFSKGTGLRSEIARYRRVFGTANVADIPVLV